MRSNLRNLAINSGYRCHCDLPRASGAQHARTLIQRRASGVHVIDDHNVSVHHARGRSHDKCSAHIFASLMTGQSRLRSCRAPATKIASMQLETRATQILYRGTCNQLRLVESSLPAFARVQWHWNHQHRTISGKLAASQRLGQLRAKHICSRPELLVLE